MFRECWPSFFCMLLVLTGWGITIILNRPIRGVVLSFVIALSVLMQVSASRRDETVLNNAWILPIFKYDHDVSGNTFTGSIARMCAHPALPIEPFWSEAGLVLTSLYCLHSKHEYRLVLTAILVPARVSSCNWINLQA